MNEMYEMLPEAMILCSINKRQYRITKINSKNIVLRINCYNDMCNQSDNLIDCMIDIYNYFEAQYDKVIVVLKYKKIVSKNEYYKEIMFDIMQDESSIILESKISDAVAHYWKYIQLKNFSYDNTFSEYMCNYDVQKDEIYPIDFAKQKRDILKEYDFNEVFLSNYTYAVKINNYVLYNKFLSMEFKEYVKWYFDNNYIYLADENYSKIKEVYIGNSFCHNLFPNEKLLIKLLECAKKEQLKVTIEFAYMREEHLEKYEELLNMITKWCDKNNVKINVVINDYGILKLIKLLDEQKKKVINDISIGILINKYRKDPRMNYKNGLKSTTDIKNHWSNEEYREFMENNNVTSCEYESNPIKYTFNMKTSITIPFYQTNTSQYCPLYAYVVNGDRGKQKLINKCKMYCNYKVFLYPTHLKMVGRYNSLFAFSENCIEDIKYYKDKDVKKVVFDFL